MIEANKKNAALPTALNLFLPPYLPLLGGMNSYILVFPSNPMPLSWINIY